MQTTFFFFPQRDNTQGSNTVTRLSWEIFAIYKESYKKHQAIWKKWNWFGEGAGRGAQVFKTWLLLWGGEREEPLKRNYSPAHTGLDWKLSAAFMPLYGWGQALLLKFEIFLNINVKFLALIDFARICFLCEPPDTWLIPGGSLAAYTHTFLTLLDKTAWTWDISCKKKCSAHKIWPSSHYAEFLGTFVPPFRAEFCTFPFLLPPHFVS